MANTNLKQLTEEYILAFDSKNITAVADMLADDAVLFDPANPKGVEGKQNIVNMIDGIFKSFNKLEFSARNIFVDGTTSIIEFTLLLDDKNLKGADIIEWKNDKIQALRAYLY